MMIKAFEVVYMLLILFILLIVLFDIHTNFQEALWRQRCKDAGGVPTSRVVCINPGAVIEVD